MLLNLKDSIGHEAIKRASQKGPNVKACVLNRRSLTTDKQDAENRLFKS